MEKRHTLCDTLYGSAYLIVTMKTNFFTRWSARESAWDVDWKQVYERLMPRVFHYFCYKVGDADAAEELTAITLEKAWAGRSGFLVEQGRFEDWVFGIARRMAIDHFRRQKTELTLDEAIQSAAEGRLEDQVQDRLSFDRISRLLEKFPKRERELVSLKYGAEMTNREIARTTGLSESNVGTILHRCVARLREMLEEEI
jgi:RNA polymerase sigma-70 factor, ECF subfamily